MSNTNPFPCVPPQAGESIKPEDNKVCAPVIVVPVKSDIKQDNNNWNKYHPSTPDVKP